MATIKLGGGPNPPVILDPAQAIVGVHWRDPSPQGPPLAFAFVVRLGAYFQDGEEQQAAPAYYSPFGSPNNPGYPGEDVPTSWDAYTYFEEDGWTPSLFYSITGLPAVGAGPSFAIGSLVPVTVFPTALNLVWDGPSGGDLGFETPVSAQEPAPKPFKAGAVAVEGLGGEDSLIFPTSIAVQAGDTTFEYAGAATLFRNTDEPLNALVDNRELVILCLPVTA